MKTTTQSPKAGDPFIRYGFERWAGYRLWSAQFPSLGNLRFWFERGIHRGSWAIQIHYGPGAGYIGGWTAAIGNRNGAARRLTGIRAGITNNANAKFLRNALMGG